MSRIPSFCWSGAAHGLALLLWASAASADPGDLDSSFGGDGIASTPEGPAIHDYPQAGAGVALQGDGRIVVVAESATHDYLARRFNFDGTLDTTFGTAGSAVVDMGGDDEPFDVALQADGSIVIVGTSIASGAPRAALARLTDTGLLDATFGSGGKVVSSFGMATNARGIAIRPDGKILIVGDAGASFFPDAFVARYDASGALDATFGAGGVAVKSIGFWSDAGFAIALQPDGAILAGGLSFLGGDYGKWFLLRLLATGTPDPSFGTGGVVETAVTSGGTSAEVLDIVVQPDGRILAAGSTGTVLLSWPSDFAVARYLSNGTLDPSWGTGGIVVTPTLTGGDFQSAPAYALALETDGSVIAVGGGGTNESFPSVQVVAVRYHTDGILDASWGDGGTVHIDEGFSGAIGTDAALQPDGRLVIGARFGFQVAALRLVAGPGCGNGAVDGTEECDDGNVSDGDCCSSTCMFVPSETPCSDGDICTTSDVCVAGECLGESGPDAMCRAAGGGSLSLRDNASDRDRLTWKWKRGAATSIEEIPAQRYTLCVYDGSTRPQPIARLETGDPQCGAGPCFTTTSRKTSYSDRGGSSDGLKKVLLKAGAAGRARIKLSAQGPALTLPSLPLVGQVSAQLHGEGGVCWGSTFGSPRQNDTSSYKARVD